MKKPLIDQLAEAKTSEERKAILKRICGTLSSMASHNCGLSLQALCILIRHDVTAWSKFLAVCRPGYAINPNRPPHVQELIDNSPACYKHELLKKILRDKWSGSGSFSLTQLQAVLDTLLNLGLVTRTDNKYAVDFKYLLQWVPNELPRNEEE
jgi:hypothetical protein